MNINIFTSNGQDWFSRQFSENEKLRHHIGINSREDILWDLVVIYENIFEPITLKHKKGGLLFISGEPPMSSVYPSRFLNQFDCLITSHPQLKHFNNILFQQSLPWLIGVKNRSKEVTLDYSTFCLKNFSKNKNISAICSFKTMMPGHNKRNEIMQSIICKFGNKIDYYGSGFNFVDDKADAILPYRFHICMENSEITDYWTEKLADPILGLSIPIYIGCTNIKEYFSEDCMFCFSSKDLNHMLNLIEKILLDPIAIYQRMLPDLLKARDRILSSYNILPTIIKVKNENMTIQEDSCIRSQIKSLSSYTNYPFLLFKLRLIRFYYKCKSKISNNALCKNFRRPW